MSWGATRKARGHGEDVHWCCSAPGGLLGHVPPGDIRQGPETVLAVTSGVAVLLASSGQRSRTLWTSYSAQEGPTTRNEPTSTPLVPRWRSPAQHWRICPRLSESLTPCVWRRGDGRAPGRCRCSSLDQRCSNTGHSTFSLRNRPRSLCYSRNHSEQGGGPSTMNCGVRVPELQLLPAGSTEASP